MRAVRPAVQVDRPSRLAPASFRAAAAVLATVLAGFACAGCYQSFSGPSLEGAPAAVQQRAELPSCGRKVSGYAGTSSDEAADACFWEAYQAQPRRAAEYQFFFFSDAGEQIAIFRIEQDGTIVIYGNWDPPGWVRQECGALEDYRADPNMFGSGFGGIGCSTTLLE